MTDIQDAIHLAAHLEHLDSESGEAKLLRRIAAAIEAKDAEIAHIYADRKAWANVELSEENDRLIDQTAKLTGALKAILTTPRDAWEFRDGNVCGVVHNIARDALSDEQRMPQGKE